MYHISEGGACAMAQWHNGQTDTEIRGCAYCCGLEVHVPSGRRLTSPCSDG